jgi:dodecin
MDDHIYKKIEITGTSTKSSDEAIRNAVAKASESIRGMSWFEVTELRGDIRDGGVAHWQATVKIGFRLGDD